MSKFLDKPASDILYKAVASLKGEEEVRLFLQDLCTVSELKAMEQRMEVAMLLDQGVQMLKIYFFGFVFMSLQFAGQSAFQALGDAKHAIFFSLLRKVFIVVPLTLLLPAVGFGAVGVFLAEPISNVIGGVACFATMYLTAYKKLPEK